MSVVCIVTNLLIKVELLEVEGKDKNSDLLPVARSLRVCYMLKAWFWWKGGSLEWK